MRAMLLALALMALPEGASPPRAQRACVPAPAGALASFKITNDGSGAAEQVASFGQVFRPGAVRPGQAIRVTLDGAEAAAQLDAKALYPDGSVRHGVVTVRTPPLAGQASKTGLISGLVTCAPPSPPPNRDVPDVQVTLTFRAGPDAGRPIRIGLPALARRAAGSRPAPWLNGPLAREQRYASDLADGVQVVFDVWTPAVGPARVDVVVHNDSAQNGAIGTRTYDAAISLGGAEAYHAPAVTHYAYATWRRTVWTGARPPLRITPDLGLLKAVGAVPPYLAVRPDPARTRELHRLSTADDRPLGLAAVTPYMPTTGGRADIGPLPAWAVFYLLDPSKQNLETLLANGDAAGSVPWHVRDMRTDGPIDIDRHPDVWLDGRGQARPGILERKYYTLDTKWQPDDAHQPSLAYLPYLLTGSQYYRDELAMQAGYVLLAIDPNYRGRSAGLVLGSQIRAVAWDLRTLANAAFILPSDSPLQRYFQAKLLANLREIGRRYVAGHELDGAGELKGYLPGPYAVAGGTPPWQDDYLAIVLGWVDRMGFHEAKPILGWMANFVAGRFTNGHRGYPPIYGTPYYLMVADPHSNTLLNSWSAAFQWTFDKAKPVTSLDSADSGGGYAALARAALAAIVDSTGSAQARQAYAFVEQQTPLMMDSYPREPAFAIGLAGDGASNGRSKTP